MSMNFEQTMLMGIESSLDKIKGLVREMTQKVASQNNERPTRNLPRRHQTPPSHELDRNIKLEIPDFHGALNPEDFLEWLRSIEKIFSFKGYDDVKKFKFATLKLQGYASLWFEDLKYQRKREGRSEIQSWNKLKRDMKARFIPVDFKIDPFIKKHNHKQCDDSIKSHLRKSDLIVSHCELKERQENKFERFLGDLNPRVTKEELERVYLPSTEGLVFVMRKEVDAQSEALEEKHKQPLLMDPCIAKEKEPTKPLLPTPKPLTPAQTEEAALHFKKSELVVSSSCNEVKVKDEPMIMLDLDKGKYLIPCQTLECLDTDPRNRERWIDVVSKRTRKGQQEKKNDPKDESMNPTHYSIAKGFFQEGIISNKKRVHWEEFKSVKGVLEKHPTVGKEVVSLKNVPLVQSKHIDQKRALIKCSEMTTREKNRGQGKEDNDAIIKLFLPFEDAQPRAKSATEVFDHGGALLGRLRKMT